MTTTLLALALAVGPGQDRAAPAAVLHEADIRIVVEQTYAAVVCAYAIDRGGDSLIFAARRLPGQVVLVDGAFGPEGELEPVHQVEQRLLVARDTTAGRGVFRLRYNVEGDFSRIPLFVPVAEPAADAALTLTIVGADELDRNEMRPSLQRGADGTLRATVSRLPETVVLSAPDASPSLPRFALWLALAALVIFSLYLLGQALARHRSRA